MPLMFGPGAIATVLGMTSSIRQSGEEIGSFVGVAAAIVATMLVTYVCLAYADALTRKLGPLGIDAATRIVGFFVSAIGVGLIFDGVIEALADARPEVAALTAHPARSRPCPRRGEDFAAAARPIAQRKRCLRRFAALPTQAGSGKRPP